MKTKGLIITLVLVVFLMSAVATMATANAPVEFIHRETLKERATRITHEFTGSVSQGQDSSQHQFDVPDNTESIEVSLAMPSGTDFDLSLWDNQNRRTGGWTASDHSTKTNIPNSAYSGYSVNPEWVNVEPVATFGIWKTGCYSYRGSGTYTITVGIFVSGPDTTPPTVSITNPVDGVTVGGTISVTASASDNVGVNRVEFYIDSVLQATDTSAPYSYSWDTTSYSDSSHTVRATAYDDAGNSASDTHTVTVDNTAPPVEGEWGITSSSFTSYSTHSNVRYMGGTSPSTDMMVTELHIRCASSGTVTIALYTGGSLNNPTGAVRRTEAHGVSVSSGWNTIDVSDYSVPANSITWIGWAHNCRVYYSTSSSNAGDFQSARGRWSQSSPSNYDENTALPSSPGSGSFSNYWYAVYAEYTTGPPPPDTTPPTVTITNPTNGATVSGTVSVTASASDNVGVTRVEFYINSVLQATDTSTPYSYSWDTTGYSDGSTPIIEAIAYDAADNSDSDAITVTVDNSGSGGNKYAIIVGISDYLYISDLSYCDEDATDWYYHLNGMGYDCQIYGDGHTNNYPIYTGSAYESTVRSAIQNLASVAQPGDTVVFTTSGHGSGNGVGSSYLCMYDCSGSQGCYYDTELAADIGLFADGVKIFVFIDHCYSGGMGPELMSLSNSANIYVATTCTQNGYGYDDPSHQNGAWTYYFLAYSWQQHFNSNPHQSMESVFDYALSNYPHGGGDTPQEFDGNSGEYFYLD